MLYIQLIRSTFVILTNFRHKWKVGMKQRPFGPCTCYRDLNVDVSAHRRQIGAEMIVGLKSKLYGTQQVFEGFRGCWHLSLLRFVQLCLRNYIFFYLHENLNGRLAYRFV